MALYYKLSKYISKHQNQEVTLKDIQHSIGCNIRVAKNALNFLIDNFDDKVTYNKNGKEKTYIFTDKITPEEIEPWVKPYSEASKKSQIKKQNKFTILEERVRILEQKVGNG